MNKRCLEHRVVVVTQGGGIRLLLLAGGMRVFPALVGILCAALPFDDPRMSKAAFGGNSASFWNLLLWTHSHIMLCSFPSTWA